MAIELVTGHYGENHVSSADVGRYNAGICGMDKYVLSTGSQFAYTVVSANEIRIASGDAVNQGRHIIIPQNTSESATIENGTTGKTRIDVIVLRYIKTTEIDPTTEQPITIETASLEVVKGTAVSTGATPAAPAVISGDIFAGAATDDMPLYHVLITDNSITSVTPVFKTLAPLAGTADLIYPVGSIYMSTRGTNPGELFGGTWQEIPGVFLLGRSSGYPAGSSGGASDVVLTQGQMPMHSHAIPTHTHNVPNHRHSVPAHTHTATVSSAGAHTHGVVHSKTGGSGTTRWAAQGSEETYNTESAGGHTHNVTVASKAAFNTTSSGACTTDGQSGARTTEGAGSGESVNIMPPYLSVYIWERTA